MPNSRSNSRARVRSEAPTCCAQCSSVWFEPGFSIRLSHKAFRRLSLGKGTRMGRVAERFNSSSISSASNASRAGSCPGSSCSSAMISWRSRFDTSSTLQSCPANGARAAWMHRGRKRVFSSIVTACSTLGAIQMARMGGSTQLLLLAVMRSTPSSAMVTWPQGWLCGNKNSSGCRSRAIMVTGMVALGASRGGHMRVWWRIGTPISLALIR